MSGLSRRGFLKGSTLLLGGLAIQQLIPQTGISFASAKTTLNRPLRMLTLGDSVMWGQGLEEENKFSHGVKRWLKQEKGIAGVELKVMAHSGATITVDKKKDEDLKWRRMDGEINRSNPTVTKQVSLAAADYCSRNIPLEDIDLILLNGGINDVDKLKFLRVSTHVKHIRKMASQYCDMEMRRLLYYTASTFPNARIIVTGYFPLITCNTPPWTIPYLIMAALRRKSLPSEALIKIVEESIHHDDEEPKDHCQGLHLILRRLSLLSESWHGESNAALCRAVTWINEKKPWTGRVNAASLCVVPSKPPDFKPDVPVVDSCPASLSAGAPISQTRVFFAPPEFKPENGYGVDKTSYLWKLVSNRDPVPCTDGFLKKAEGRIITDDELHSRRPCWCCEAGRRNNAICLRAATFHPNINGAAAYKAAIVKELEKFYADAGWGDIQWGTAPDSSDHPTPGEACVKHS